VNKLRAYIRKQGAKGAGRPSIEDVLLGGRFSTYAVYRLAVFMVARCLGTVTHVLELTVLLSLFSSKRLIGSFVAQQGTVLALAFFWGCLEVMRARLREETAKTEMIRRVEHWLSWALWLGVAVTLVPFAGLAVLAVTGRHPPVLGLYVAVCCLRLGVDLVTRTYYSGVWALGRVHRPALSILITEPIGLVAIVLSYRVLGLYAFIIGLVATTAVSRGLAIYYTRRTYRLLRMPSPRFGLFRFTRRLPGSASLLTVLKGGAANLTTRLGSILVLATLIGPLVAEASYTPLVLGLQVSAVLLGATTYYTQVFYHDFRRLEADAFARLRRRLERRLVPTAIAVGTLLWALSALVLYFFLGAWNLVAPVVLLLPVYLVLPCVSILQLREFVRGEFVRLLVSAMAVWIAMAVGGFLIEEPQMHSWSLTLALSLFAGVVVLALPFGRRKPSTTGVHASLQAWVRSVSAVRGPVRVGRIAMPAATSGQCTLVAQRIAERLGSAGGVLALAPARRVLYYERGRPELTRAGIVVLAGGKVKSLDETAMCRDGCEAMAEAERGLLVVRRGSADSCTPSSLIDAFRQAFRCGLVADLRTGRLSPDLTEIDRRTRRAIFRDAERECRLGTTSGQLSSFEVTSYRPGGELRILFAVPRSEPADVRQAWRDRIAAANWDASTVPGASSLRANAVATT
jgi:hypothetical protein